MTECEFVCAMLLRASKATNMQPFQAAVDTGPDPSPLGIADGDILLETGETPDDNVTAVATSFVPRQ